MSACEIFRQAEQATGAGSLETRAIRRSASHSQRQHRSLALNQAANLSAGCEVEQTIEVLASSEKSMACCERSNHNWGSSEIWCRLEGCDTSIRVLVHERRWGWASQAAGGPAFAGLCLRVSDQRGTRELTTGRRSPASPPLTAGLRLPYDDGAGTSAPPGEQFLPMGTPLSRHAGNRRPVKGVNCSFLSSTARFPSEKNSSTVGPGLYHEPRPAVSRGGHGTVPWSHERRRFEERKAFTGPGPGQYEAPVSPSRSDFGRNMSSAFAHTERVHPPHVPLSWRFSQRPPDPGKYHGAKPGAFDPRRRAGSPTSVPFRDPRQRFAGVVPRPRAPDPGSYDLPGAFHPPPAAAHSHFRHTPGHGGPLVRPVRLSEWVVHLVGHADTSRDEVPGPGRYSYGQGTVAYEARRSRAAGQSAAFRTASGANGTGASEGGDATASPAPPGLQGSAVWGSAHEVELDLPGADGARTRQARGGAVREWPPRRARGRAQAASWGRRGGLSLAGAQKPPQGRGRAPIGQRYRGSTTTT